MTSITSRRFACILLALSMGVACAEPAAELRRHTYPPGFRYISADEIEGTMWQLASLTNQLEQLTSEPSRFDARRGEISQVLRALESAADALKGEGVPTNHPLIRANLDRYRDSVRGALRDVEHEPPSYLRAHALPSACVYCHSN